MLRMHVCRALEFREKTAQQCVQQAYLSPGQDAVRYLRRAVELCGDANFSVQVNPMQWPHHKRVDCTHSCCMHKQTKSSPLLLQGLTRSCIQYVQTHPSKRQPSCLVPNGSAVCDNSHPMLCANPNHFRLCTSCARHHACHTHSFLQGSSSHLPCLL